MEFDDLEASLRSPRSDLDQDEIEIELACSQDEEQKSQQLNQRSQKKDSGGQDLSRTSGANKSGNKKKGGNRNSSKNRKEAA